MKKVLVWRLARGLPVAPLMGVAALALAACGSEAAFEEAAPTVPLKELPAKYAAAVCKAYTACLGPLGGVFLPGEDCVQRTTDQVEDALGATEAAVEAGRIKYDGSKVQGCANELERRTCDELLERDPDACTVVFQGKVADGGACSLSEECKGQGFCNFGTSCPGTCSPLQATGGACQSDSQCASGLVCSEATERCVTPAGPGDICGGAEPECAPGFFCKGASADSGTSGNCRAYAEVFAAGAGASCDILAGDFCAAGLGCQIDSFQNATLSSSCAAKVGSGDACKIAFPDQCPDAQYCSVPALSLEGSCTARPKVGEDCGLAPFATEGSVCGPYARCDAGKCRALAGLGESCEANDVCLSGHCEGSACVSPDSCN